VLKSSKQPARPWRVIAEEMSHASRGDRILELAEELEQAFEEQTSPHKPVQGAVTKVADKSRNDPQPDPQQQKQGS